MQERAIAKDAIALAYFDWLAPIRSEDAREGTVARDKDQACMMLRTLASERDDMPTLAEASLTEISRLVRAPVVLVEVRQLPTPKPRRITIEERDATVYVTVPKVAEERS